MLNRRGFLGVVGAVTAVSKAQTTEDAHSAVEPKPARFDAPDFNCGVRTAPSACTVGYALARLGWESDAAPRPLLVVHPSYYALAKEVEHAFDGALAIWATPRIGDDERWFVVWRGQRLGSV